MKIIELLWRDHQEFYSQFDRLEENLQVAGKVAEIRTQVSKLNTALQTHAQLEDELLFATLEPYIGEMGPLTVMRLEHTAIEDTFAQLQVTTGAAETEQLVTHLLTVARSHFAKEEQILFPLSEQVLSTDTLDELGEQFMQRRGTVVI